MKKLTIAKAAINLAATNRAKEVLGSEQFKKNRDAVRSIKEDFIAAVEWAMKQTSVDHGAYQGHELITNERMEQIIRGYDAAHDDRETKGQLAEAAALYALEDTSLTMEGSELPWPWPQSSYPDKRGKLDRVRQLTIAGALIAAEIDRIIRQTVAKKESEVAS